MTASDTGQDRCGGCRYLGSDCAPPDAFWPVCDHPSFEAQYPAGRSQDEGPRSNPITPRWCPGRVESGFDPFVVPALPQGDDTKAARLLRVEDVVTAALSSLEELFISGVTLTFVARHPTNPDAHFVVSREKSLEVLVTALEETIRSRAEAGL